jgi:hypothetical protein
MKIRTYIGVSLDGYIARPEGTAHLIYTRAR